MSSYFTIKELTYSATAVKNGIDNTPSLETITHLKELIEFLNPIREAWGSPIKVTSGYRSYKVNQLVGGSATSAHRYGWASDLVPVKGTVEELFKFIANYLKENNLLFDQLIMEKSSTSKWVHLGLKNKSGKQRKQIFNLNV